jgi:hypothetical protein
VTAPTNSKRTAESGSTVRKSTTFRRVRNRAVLILFGILVGAIFAELGLRVIGFSYPQFYEVDPQLGYALRPNIEGWYRKEGTSYVRINRDGQRDRDHEKTKPPNTYRVAIVGDSYSEAMHVDMDRAFWKVIERNLPGCGTLAGKQVEVINFGVSGYGTAQEYLMLERVWQYSPDLILLAVTTNNDVTDNSRALRKSTDIPYFVYTDGHLTMDSSFRETKTFRLRQSVPSRLAEWIQDRSRVIQVVISANRSVKYWLAERRARREAAKANEARGPQPGPVQGEEPGIENVVYTQPIDSNWNEAWKVTEGLMALMRDEARQRNTRFVVATLSQGIQVYPDAGVRQNFMNRYGIADLFYPDHQFEKICERLGVPAIILGPRLQEYAEQNKIFLHGFGSDLGNGHWNESGHKIAGELLARDLCADVAN